jgi:hypothetical protein
MTSASSFFRTTSTTTKGISAMARRNKKRKRDAMSGDSPLTPKDAVAPMPSRKKPKREKRSFTSLPAEIRLNIYKFLFEGSTIKVDNLMDDEIKITAPVVQESFSVLVTCRLVHDEAQTVLAEQSALTILGDCRKSALPKLLRRVYLPRVQHLILSSPDDDFRLKNCPNLKRVSINTDNSDIDVEYEVKKSRLKSMIPYIMGSKDTRFIRKWLQSLEELRAKSMYDEDGDQPDTIRLWKRIDKLDPWVKIERTIHVCVVLINTINGAEVELEIVSSRLQLPTRIN